MNWLFWHLLPPGMTFIDLIRLVDGWWKWWEKWLVSVLSTHLYLYLSFSLYMYISVYLSFYVSIFLFIYLSNYLSIYISVFLSSLLVKKKTRPIFHPQNLHFYFFLISNNDLLGLFTWIMLKLSHCFPPQDIGNTGRSFVHFFCTVPAKSQTPWADC